MTPRLAFAIDAAYRGGRHTLAYFNTGVETIHKADDSPVTVADREAEQLIRNLIEGAYPGDAIVGEEYGASGSGRDRWVIDPIDGTKSFVCGVPLYGTLLSYEVGGIPVLGVAYFPALDEMVYAEVGGGAFWNGRPCRVSERPTLSGASLACGGHASMAKFGRMEGLLRLSEKAQATRTWCDAYGHILVATGRVEAMIDPVVNPWDISAIKPIVEEAGGRFTDFSGAPNPQSEAISCCASLHTEIVGAFRV